MVHSKTDCRTHGNVNTTGLSKEREPLQKTTITMETPKEKLSDVIYDLNISRLSRTYFQKSPSWLYHKFDGRDGNGATIDFTEQELDTLRNALLDLSDRIRTAAEKL